MHQPWIEHAACKGIDTEVFFAETVEAIHEAQAICRDCPVKRECLDYAVEANCTFGVYGGLTHRQRRTILSAGYWPGKNPDEFRVYLARTRRG